MSVYENLQNTLRTEEGRTATAKAVTISALTHQRKMYGKKERSELVTYYQQTLILAALRILVSVSRRSKMLVFWITTITSETARRSS